MFLRPFQTRLILSSIMCLLIAFSTHAQSCNTIVLPDSLYVCAGNRDTLHATLTGTDSVLHVVWSPATGLSSTTILDPVLTASTSGWYTVSVTSVVPNLIVNGNFSAGNTGFTSGYNYITLVGSDDPGDYGVGTDPNFYNTGWPVMGDHTTGTGNMLCVDGSLTSGISFWCESVAVIPGTTYTFSVWSSLFATPLPSIQLQINGSVVGTFAPSGTTGRWTEYTVTWNSGTATTADLCLYDLSLVYGGNDFGIDDISFTGTCVSTDSIYVAVIPPDTTHIATDTAVCATVSSVTLTAPSGYTAYSWSNGATTATINVTATGTYWVTETGPCIAQTDTFHVTFKPIPLVNLGDDTTFCSGNSVTLQSSDTPYAGPIYLWNTGSTSAAITAAITGAYWLDVTVNGCTGSDTVNVTVTPTPPAPTVSSILPICSGTSLQLTAAVAATYTDAATYSWSGPNGFTSLLQNPSINPAYTDATGIYSVFASYEGCTSPITTAAALVDSTPAPLVVTTPITLCQYSTVFLTASTITSGVTYNWTSSTGFTSTEQNPVIDSANTGTTGIYRIVGTYGTCYDTANVVVTIDSIPLLSQALSSNSPVCSGGTLQLYSSFTPPGGSVYWSGPNGFTSAIISNTEIYSVTMAATGIYSVYASLDICTSATYTISVTIDSTPVVPTLSSNSPVCQGDTLKLYSADATTGVTYSWSGPNGYSSLLENPILTNVPYAATGEYTVTATLGICSDSAETLVNITITPSFTPTSNSPVCSGDSLFLYANGDSGSYYTWSGPYGYYAFDSTSSSYRFIVNTTIENAGVYTVTAFLNGCSTPETDTVIINNTPAAPSISWLTYCQYYPAPPLMANDTNVKWYLTDATLPSLGSYTPPVPSTRSVGSTYFYARQIVDGCISAQDSIKVTVYPTPTVTVSPADTAVCPHSTVVLRATDTAANTYYQWSPSIYLNSTNTADVTVSPETNQSYNVVASNQYGCADTAGAVIKVYPSALISMADSVTLYPGQTYTMNPSTNCTIFAWFPPAGLSSTSIPDPVATPLLSTNYILYGQTEDGCTTTDSISIYLSTASLIDMPNAFTPGNGADNMLYILKKGVATINYYRIFNRWGQKVFETNNIDAGWDGSFNGTPQPLGVYVYEIEAITNTGQVFDKQGNITLLR